MSERIGLAINGVLRKITDTPAKDDRPEACRLWVEYELEDDRNPEEPEPVVDTFYLPREKVPLTLKRGDPVSIAVKLIPASADRPARLMAIRAHGGRKNDQIGTQKVT